MAAGSDFEAIVNPSAWSPEAAEASGIGPAHPCHPYYRVYYDADGQQLSVVDEVRFVHGFRDAEVLFAHLGFPALNVPEEATK